MSNDLEDEEQNKLNRMNVIYNALEDGWTVKKSDTNPKTFEFTKNQSHDMKYRGLIIYSNKMTIFEEINKHFEYLKVAPKISPKMGEFQKNRRSISAPVRINFSKS